ncbi:hypothetical protein [Sphingobium xanthum]|uniref:hypothetical protein n=1 Tax=Sphingobium xanthum TaxID=1387165 RepID=UPI001C8C7F39|nr:hypothetical protein [Sphingobium xanthum]
MNRGTVFAALMLGACSATDHNFVVDTSEADRPVVKAVLTLCDQPPKTLLASGKWFVGQVRACEGGGNIELQHIDGSISNCRIGYVTTMSDWWLVKVRGRVCDVQWVPEPTDG